MQTPQFAATRMGRGFPGGLLCRSACQGEWPLAAPRFAHSIPESRRRGHAGLNQRFLDIRASNSILSLLRSYTPHSVTM
jgi:hypothetical protein